MRTSERGKPGTKVRHRKSAHRRNRKLQRVDHKMRAALRAKPATADQLEAMRLIASENGRTFTLGITQGDAWRRIRAATAIVGEPMRKRCAPPCWTPEKTVPRAR